MEFKPLRPHFPLETARLILRPYGSDDFDWLHDLRGHKPTMQYVPFGGETRERIKDVLSIRMGMNKIESVGGKMILVICRKDTGARIGEASLFSDATQDNTGEIGYILHPDHVGHGFATEAAAEMMRLGFVEAGFHRIIANCDAENEASKAVMRRLGMREEAHFVRATMMKGQWRDQNTFAILADEWHQAQQEVGDQT